MEILNITASTVGAGGGRPRFPADVTARNNEGLPLTSAPGNPCLLRHRRMCGNEITGSRNERLTIFALDRNVVIFYEIARSAGMGAARTSIIDFGG
jgi:hypothetical protein